jgi:hypothetical protein
MELVKGSSVETVAMEGNFVECFVEFSDFAIRAYY